MLSKHQKYFFSSPRFLITDLEDLFDIQNSREKMVCENAFLAPSRIWPPLRLIGLSCFLAISKDYRDRWTTRRDHL